MGVAVWGDGGGPTLGGVLPPTQEGLATDGLWELCLGLGHGSWVLWPPPQVVLQSAWAVRKQPGKGFPEAPGEKAPSSLNPPLHH